MIRAYRTVLVTPLERFLAKVRQTETCWLWTAAKGPGGHGVFSMWPKLVQAHRWSYEHYVGPIPRGRVIDHLCGVPSCVNPKHLQPVRHRENTKRGWAAKRKSGYRSTQAARAEGPPAFVYVDIETRFWNKVEKTKTCWLWVGALRFGYGVFTLVGNERQVMAHRWSYERFVGPIPAGLLLDHLCRVKRCVNPAHLEPVTCKENIRRGELRAYLAKKNLSTTACRKGHPYSEDNTYIQKRGAALIRRCRVCERAVRKADPNKLARRYARVQGWRVRKTAEALLVAL